MSDQGEVGIGKARADVLAGRICAAAGLAARSECELVELIGEFDAGDGLRWWVGVKSVAHWLSWCCSLAPHTAREYVRVARALRQMPTLAAAFREGRLSYSKVREATRVVGVIDEQQLCALALTATASQLARMLSAYRRVAGSRIRLERDRQLSWHERENGAIDFRIRLPKEQAGVVIAALSAAKDQFGAPPSAACTAGSTAAETADPVQDLADDPGVADPGVADRCVADRGVEGRGEGFAGEAPDGPGRAGADASVLEPAAGAGQARGRSRWGGATDRPAEATPPYGYCDAIVDVAQAFLTMAPQDRSGEDRTLVVVHVSAEQLSGRDAATVGGNAAAGSTDAAGTPAPPDPSDPADRDDHSADRDDHSAEHVPAPSDDPTRAEQIPAEQPRTEQPRAGQPRTGAAADPTCHIDGLGGIEPETARRLACDSEVVGAVVDLDREVLAFGRSRRLVSRAQRRALMIRDGICQFPSCHQTRHLQAHHVVHWSQGGSTDLENLILLCQAHHTFVHEGGMTIHRIVAGAGSATMPAGSPSAAQRSTPGRVVDRWEFRMPDGKPIQSWLDYHGLSHVLATDDGHHAREHAAIIEGVDGFGHPDAQRIVPGWRGERFDLHECVQALFRMQRSDTDDQPDTPDKNHWEAA